MSKNYQSNAYTKNSKSKDDFSRRKDVSLHKQIDGERLDRLKDWTTLYRNNIHIFVEHYMGVHLYPYQRLWIYLISHSTRFFGYASRASAKSWLIAVYAVAKCILYPNTIVSLNSSTKEQAGLIISQKIDLDLYKKYPNITREISHIVTNANKWRVDFHNGSMINVVISGEGGRGHRSNISVLEERRLVPTSIINSIIRPFRVARNAPFRDLKEYKHLPPEEPQEVIISSVHYKSGEWYPEMKKMMKAMANGSPTVKGIFFDYLISLRHGIKTELVMQEEKEHMDDVTFSMEYLNIPFSGGSSSFYKLDFFKRSLKRAWLPRRLGIDGTEKNKYDIPRVQGERRLMSVDVATRKGSKNDNSVISCARLLPTKKGWKTEIVYLESHNGETLFAQALRIKQIYAEFSGLSKDGEYLYDDDIIILDVANVGIGVYENLSMVTSDEERDIEYPAMDVIKHESISEKVQTELEEKCLTPDAFKCIFPISAGATLNSQIASAFRARLKSKLLTFLVDENQQEEFFIKKKNKDITKHEDIALRAYILAPNVQTTLLINECISLDMSMTEAQLVKLKEQSGSRKDRYSSVSYLNYFASFLDAEILRIDDGLDTLDVWAGAFGVV